MQDFIDKLCKVDLALSIKIRPLLNIAKHRLQVCILQTATDILSPLLAWLLAADRRQFAVRLLQSSQLALYTTGHKYLNSHSY